MAVIRYGLRPAEFWRLSPKQLDCYRRAFDDTQKADAEIANARAARMTSWLLAAWTGKVTDPADIFPSLYDQPKPAFKSQSSRSEALQRQNEAAFAALEAMWPKRAVD